MIPQAYIVKQGPIVSANIGDQYGRSLAIFGSRGLCVLKIHRENMKLHYDAKSNDEAFNLTTCVEGYECYVDKSCNRRSNDQWLMFHRTQEDLFSVKELCWWENYNGENEDVIVAIITYIKNPSDHYLVAWSVEK